jgi:hypothetical protein
MAASALVLFHQVIVGLAVVAALILATGWIVVLWHRPHQHEHQAQPPAAVPAVTRAEVQATAEAVVLQHRVSQLERQADVRTEVERQLAAQSRREAIEAAQVHTHGLTLADIIAARQQDERPAIEA